MAVRNDLYRPLSVGERKTIREIERELKESGIRKNSELETGRLLLTARHILEPYGSYLRWLEQLQLNYRTALRRTDIYEYISQHWPKILIQEAIKSGFTVVGFVDKEHPLGAYSEMPMPRKAMTPAQARAYLANLQTQYRDRVAAVINSPDVIIKECFRFIDKRLPAVPESERERFCDNLVGMMMTRMGMSGVKEFRPKAIPEDFPIATSSRSERSPEVREKIAAAARARWERIRGGA